MKIRQMTLFAASIAAICLITADLAHGQQPGATAKPRAAEPAAIHGLQGVPQFGASGAGSRSTTSDVRNSRMSASELRQARAQYRSRQRIARLEYNLWMGYEPLRPNWNSIPMMSSRYTGRQVYVPLYVHTR